MAFLDQIPALIAELRDASGDGSDWTEDLFSRAANGLEELQDELAGTQREWGETLDLCAKVIAERNALRDSVN